MTQLTHHPSNWTFQSYTPWLVLLVLLTFTYGYFFQAVFVGFRWEPDGQIDEIYVTPDAVAPLLIGDKLITVGSLQYSDFQADWRKVWMDGLQPGDTVELVVERQGQRMQIDWEIPGPNPGELLNRLNNQWYLAYIFWMVGTVAVLILRPVDTRWRLLVAFNYITALWLLASSLARFHLWGSLFILRASIWVSVPVYLHLNWILPRPLTRLPRFIVGLFYLISCGLVVTEWLQIIPRSAYYIGLAIALTGSLVLMLVHLLLQADRRRDVTTVFSVAALSIVPIIIIGIAGAVNPSVPNIIGGALFALPLIPITYLYTAYRHRLGDLEIRANQIISVYIYIIVLGSLCFLISTVALAVFQFPQDSIVVSTLVSIFAGLLTAFGYHRFQRLIEQRLLGMPLPSDELVKTYAARIATSLDEPTLIQLLDKEVLPSLLIRQSALVLSDGKTSTPLYTTGVNLTQLPTDEDITKLLSASGLQPTLINDLEPAAWVKLVLPLAVNRSLVGLWFLGRHDPDDFYNHLEIEILQSLAHQTAIALTNIMQAARLRALYQNDVDQREAERASIARELHDSVLNELKLLRDTVQGDSATSDFLRYYSRASANLRQTITNLRPAMLNYGLRPALAGYIDDLIERMPDGPTLLFEIAEDELPVMHPESVVLHIYRITQQACENALRHAKAKTIRLSGQISHELIDITIRDDGIGFETKGGLDLSQLVAHKHFGLAGMHERAMLIGGKLYITSAPQQGMQVQVVWTERERPNSEARG